MPCVYLWVGLYMTELCRYWLVLMKSQLFMHFWTLFHFHGWNLWNLCLTTETSDTRVCQIKCFASHRPSWACWNWWSFKQPYSASLRGDYSLSTNEEKLPLIFYHAPRLWACGELSVWCQPGRSLTLWFGCGESGRYVSHHYLKLLAAEPLVASQLNFAVWHCWCCFWQSTVLHLNCRGGGLCDIKSVRLLGNPWKINPPLLMGLAVCPCRKEWGVTGGKK